MKHIFNKIFILPLFALGLTVAVSCSEEELETFDVNTNYVQFIDKLTDSTELSFQLFPGKDKFTHTINVEMLGLPFSKATPYGVVVNKELSTAKEGTHFSLPESFEFVADTNISSFDMEFKYTKEMDTKTFKLVLDIVDKENVYAGVNYRHTISINNSIVRPSWWDNDRWSAPNRYLGPYSLSKYKHLIIAINESGTNFSDIDFENIGNSEFYSYALIFSTYIKINAPVDEDSGADIEIPVK